MIYFTKKEIYFFFKNYSITKFYLAGLINRYILTTTRFYQLAFSIHLQLAYLLLVNLLLSPSTKFYQSGPINFYKQKSKTQLLLYYNLLIYLLLFIVRLSSSQLLLPYYNFDKRKAKITKNILDRKVSSTGILVAFAMQFS